ncbi:MAG: hypothetical protein AAFQ79_11520 [Pseudomonadota bacterium]
MPQDSAQDHIELLLSQNRITHIITGSGERPLSGAALIQRCLSAGLENPVPLPDGTVAVHMPQGLPDTLAALNLSARALHPDGEPAAAPPHVSDRERLAAIDAAIQELEARIGRDLAAVTGHRNPPVEPAAEPVDEAPGNEGEPALEAGARDSEPMGDPLLLTAENMGPAPHPEEPVEDAADNEDGIFELSFLPDGSEPAAGESGSAADGSGVDSLESEPVLGECEPDEADPTDSGAEMDASDATSVGVDHAGAALQGSEVFAPTEAGLGAPGRDDAVTQLSERLVALETVMSDQREAFAAMSAAVHEVADRPLPRPDMSEANRAFARFTTAFAHALGRLERVSDGLQSMSEAAETDGVAGGMDGLGAGLSDLAAAIARASERPAQGPDVAHLVSLQTVMIRQLAAILDAQRPKANDAVEEFLADLRHNVAEIVAEETQSARAS